ncbi:hypothetical protein, partial [Aeromonas dhakensis]|uniref:hypothetical protein n=1 Tax=Aeromonas dhakensis TaxID=196024 RepID=UPI001E2D2730
MLTSHLGNAAIARDRIERELSRALQLLLERSIDTIQHAAAGLTQIGQQGVYFDQIGAVAIAVDGKEPLIAAGQLEV